jgi:hypothetical protein
MRSRNVLSRVFVRLLVLQVLLTIGFLWLLVMVIAEALA